MKTGTKILLGVAAAGAVGAYAYRMGVNNVQFSLDGYQPAPDGAGLLMRIKATNTNKFFGYPVPQALINVFDSNSNFLGTAVNHQLQYIPANGTSFIYAVVQPNYANLVSVIMGIINNGALPTNLIFNGLVKVGPVEIPFDTGARIAGIGNLKEGIMYVPLFEQPEIKVGDILVHRTRESIYTEKQNSSGSYHKLLHGSKRINETWYEVLKLYRTSKGELRMRLKDLTYGYTPSAVVSEWIAPKGFETFKVV